MLIPKNVEIMFESYCGECDMCEPVCLTFLKNDKPYQRITCNNTAICVKVREIVAKEKARDYPFA